MKKPKDFKVEVHFVPALCPEEAERRSERFMKLMLEGAKRALKLEEQEEKKKRIEEGLLILARIIARKIQKDRTQNPPPKLLPKPQR